MLNLKVSNRSRILLFQIFPTWRGLELDMRLPLGMLNLANSLKKSGYKVEIYHIEDSQCDSILSKINFSDVLFIGVCSVLTGFSLRSAINFSKKVKKIDNNISIVWGGIQVTAIPEVCLKNDFVDAVGVGEGEELIVQIAKVFNGEIDPFVVKGFAFKDKVGEIFVNDQWEPIKNLDDYGPDYSFIDLNKYIFRGRVSGLMITSKGCPFSCAFCYNDYYYRDKKIRWRKHSSEYIINLLKYLKSKYNFHAFSFSDDNFFVDRERAVGILEEVHKLGLKTYSVDIKINNIMVDDIKAMGKLGVESVFFGTESLNSRLIKLINKRQTKERVIEVISQFAKYAPDIQVQTEILMALPFERKSELRRDIKEGLDLYKYNKNLSLYFGVLFPLPKTKMMEYANINGFSPKTIYDYANIDLNTAWSICDQWTLFDLSKKERYKLGLVEKYAALIASDRRLQSRSLYGILKKVKAEVFFRLVKFRLKNWFFFFHELDFWVWRVLIPKLNNILSVFRPF